MGVINITPNSFSDGGEFTSRETFLEQFKKLQALGVQIFDLGAESTAPFNQPISSELEWQRLSPMIECLFKESALKSSDSISIDTYKFDVFKQAYALIRSFDESIRVIWNDVSGKLEDEVLDFLDAHNFELVISHNLSPKRSLTSEHMNFCADKIDLVDYFSRISNTLEDRGLSSKCLFDPCFGFSKTLEQNYELLSTMDTWLDGQYRWVIGVSRKSFLQKLCFGDDKIKESELIHTSLLSKWMRSFSDRSITIRLHDPSVFLSAQLVK